ncbi:MAG: hypothetical protein JWN86_177 [Planctomycetota bacterium]|nr:hypothetical protein [Planctomycetota bacterium]
MSLGVPFVDLTERDEQLGAIDFACLDAAERGEPLDRGLVIAEHP